MPQKIVHVIEGAKGAGEGSTRLLESLRYTVRVFASAPAYLAEPADTRAHCLLVEASAPAAIGCDPARFMEHPGIHAPVVFVAHAPDVRAAVRAMKAGAIDYLAMPVRDVDLLGAVAAATARADARAAGRARRERALSRVAKLTAREREIFELVLAGKLNKQIADVLDSRIATVKVHRSRLMHKLEVRSLAELLRLGHELAPMHVDAWETQAGRVDRGRSTVPIDEPGAGIGRSTPLHAPAARSMRAAQRTAA